MFTSTVAEPTQRDIARTARLSRYAAPAEMADPTLKDALEIAMRDRWSGTRSEHTTYSQARQAVEFLAALILQDDNGTPESRIMDYALRSTRLSDVEPSHVIFAVTAWRAQKLAPGTINKRLNCLSLMGINVKGRRQKRIRALKWWLKPDVEVELVRNLMAAGDDLMADYITWTTRTGLRVEETLALTKAAFSEDATGKVSVTVPGLKTATSQATLPLGDEAVEVYRARFAPDAPPSTRMFPITYLMLLAKWDLCRAMLGVTDDPLATLKALRRSAARYLHTVRGMPVDLVRNYLRHENIATTMEYLRLTGGYGTEEYRKWL